MTSLPEDVSESVAAEEPVVLPDPSEGLKTGEPRNDYPEGYPVRLVDRELIASRPPKDFPRWPQKGAVTYDYDTFDWFMRVCFLLIGVALGFGLAWLLHL